MGGNDNSEENVAAGDYQRRLRAALHCRQARNLQAAADLPAHYLDDLGTHVIAIAAVLAARTDARRSALLVGVNGNQGSGKSTLAQFLKVLLEAGADKQVCVLSLDDFYHDAATRRELASTVHPLFSVRGVPGTHDMALLNRTLDILLDPARAAPVPVPVFDKASDDALPHEQWISVAAAPDIVLLEGWCVGSPPQASYELNAAVNALERQHDKDRAWRRYVNERLDSDYRETWQRLDVLLMLLVPDFSSVRTWRRQQEERLDAERKAAGVNRSGILSGPELDRFIDYFERLSRFQQRVLPTIADAVIELDSDHRMQAHYGPLLR